MLKTAQKCSRAFKLVGFHKKYSQIKKPQHLICFKNWDKEMIMNVLNSAIALKMKYPCTRLKHLKLLKNHKVLIISESNEPTLTAAVTQAAWFLSADICSVENKFLWDHDYNGRIFSFMADAIFASTTTHACVERMAHMSLVPVMCLKSRTNATLQALAIMMTIIEEYGKIECQNIAYIGPPEPILNSLMLLSALLGANIRLKCCSKKIPHSPLLLKISRDFAHETGTLVETFTSVTKTLQYSNVIIAGPTARKEQASIFYFDMKDIADSTRYKWIFIHCCPRGKEVNDLLFYGRNSRTFNVFYNLQYIAAALMAYTVKRHLFSTLHDC